MRGNRKLNHDRRNSNQPLAAQNFKFIFMDVMERTYRALWTAEPNVGHLQDIHRFTHAQGSGDTQQQSLRFLWNIQGLRRAPDSHIRQVLCPMLIGR